MSRHHTHDGVLSTRSPSKFKGFRRTLWKRYVNGVEFGMRDWREGEPVIRFNNGRMEG